MWHEDGRMFGDHIARALAREHQRDLVPDLRTLEGQRTLEVQRTLEGQRGARGDEDGETPVRRGRSQPAWRMSRAWLALAQLRGPGRP
jgi:hypothetical protein